MDVTQHHRFANLFVCSGECETFSTITVGAIRVHINLLQTELPVTDLLYGVQNAFEMTVFTRAFCFTSPFLPEIPNL